MFKNILKRLSGFFKELTQKDDALKILSVLSAIVIWAVISITIYPTVERVYVLPISVDLEGSYAQANQLDVMSVSDQTVTVTISGNRGQIGDLSAEDFTVSADVTSVMLAREYNLNIDIACTDDREFEVVSIEPSTVSVSFDKIVSAEFEVEVDTSSLKIASGYMMGDPIITPETVTVTGAQDKVNSITKVVASVYSDAELDSTVELNVSELTLYNNSAIISNEDKSITFDKTSFAVQVPVYVRQTLPLKVTIINAPERFDVESFREQLVFSLEEIDIAAPNDRIKEITSLNIGTINMREVDIGSEFTFNAADFMPEGYENLSGVEIVTVTCPSEGLAKKAIGVRKSAIQFVNAPSQFEFEIITSGFTPTFVGSEEHIEELTIADISAQIDLIDFDMQEGDHKMAVEFEVLSYDDVWVIGENGVATPKAVVTATLKDDS